MIEESFNFRNWKIMIKRFDLWESKIAYLFGEQSVCISQRLVFLRVKVGVGLLNETVHERGLAVMKVANESNVPVKKGKS